MRMLRSLNQVAESALISARQVASPATDGKWVEVKVVVAAEVVDASGPAVGRVDVVQPTPGQLDVQDDVTQDDRRTHKIEDEYDTWCYKCKRHHLFHGAKGGPPDDICLDDYDEIFFQTPPPPRMQSCHPMSARTATDEEILPARASPEPPPRSQRQATSSPRKSRPPHASRACNRPPPAR